ncbi:hypothetical protein FACS189459_5880 [Bacilli bacterium]|nr:hypothetical protein FACS189459_5880 [Bacilli bacterium]
MKLRKKVNMNNNINILLKQFGINPKNYSLFLQAFTHSSYSYEKKLNYSYERLEFLGDAIIKYVVSKYLYSEFNEDNEGEMSKKCANIIQSDSMIYVAKKLSFEKCILLGAAVAGNENNHEKIYEDCFESFTGAIYLDQGEKKCEEFIIKTLIHNYKINALDKFKDYKTMLIEFMRANNLPKPVYKPKQNENGYIEDVYINGVKITSAVGDSSKSVRKSSNKNLYKRLVSDPELVKKLSAKKYGTI